MNHAPAGTRGDLSETIVFRLLSHRRLPIWISYLGTILLVLLAAAIRYELGASLIGYPILLFFPAVFLCALLFDNGAGYLATALSAAIAWAFFMSPAITTPAGGRTAVPLMIFIVVCAMMSAVTDALRRTVRRLDEAERGKSLLLDELAHRTKNDLATISAAITLQSNASPEPAVKEALAQANARVMIVASAQDRLRADFGDDARLDLAGYVDRLCRGLGDLLRGVRPIAVRVDCASVMVQSSTAVTVGLIINELVTNCFKYAFPDDTAGTVKVTVQAEGPRIVIDVEDDGIGCPEDFTPGLGSRLVRLLAQQKGGTFTREDTTPGCHVRVDLTEISGG